MIAAHLDDWMARPAVRSRHRRRAAAPAAALWTAAAELRLSDTRTLGRLVRWRIPGTPPAQTFRGLLAEYPFVVLDEGERWSLSGLCGRIWTLTRDYPRLAGPEAFRAWDEPGTVRVLFAHWVEDDGAGGSAIVSEARVQPVDRAAEVRLRSLWLVVGVFERLIGAESLELAVARAEGRA
ncbi:MAG TPA: hypothetical protein VHF51_09200 [Solirubrobacteraceae bacterium]|nr:hypothetical protein [Solirubrobacteraceae bacterium]